VKILAQKALHRRVLVVAVEGDIGDWAAYIADVPGKSHATEAQKVAEEGEKVIKEIAQLLFPWIELKYRE
jgi:hypothetical protein